MNKKYITWIVAIIVIVGLIGVFSNQGAPQPAQAPSSRENSGQQTVQENPTGNIDDAVAAISADVESDNLPTVDSDSAILSENDQALNDFGQSFDTQLQ